MYCGEPLIENGRTNRVQNQDQPCFCSLGAFLPVPLGAQSVPPQQTGRRINSKTISVRKTLSMGSNFQPPFQTVPVRNNRKFTALPRWRSEKPNLCVDPNGQPCAWQDAEAKLRAAGDF
jgi:hypothetical protein